VAPGAVNTDAAVRDRRAPPTNAATRPVTITMRWSLLFDTSCAYSPMTMLATARTVAMLCSATTQPVAKASRPVTIVNTTRPFSTIVLRRVALSTSSGPVAAATSGCSAAASAAVVWPGPASAVSGTAATPLQTAGLLSLP
jgi:hypothetical protein